ncbi:MAG: hypothetical protein Q4G04_03880, partial [bacterium]|nr:hypothetical protein [bacterium]
YSLFIKTDKQDTPNSLTTASTSITITTVSGSTSDMTNLLPMSDTDGQNTTPYVFTVTNTGNVPQMVDISLISDSATVTIDGCSDNQLNQNYLKVSIDGGEPFALSQNSGVVINDLGLESSESKTYSLRYWLSSDTPNSEIGKHFHGLVTTSGYGIEELPELALDNSGANMPELADGMIPVMYNGSAWVKADTVNPVGVATYPWYDYDNQLWANAIMVTSGTRDTYMNASPGFTITEADVLAYYVWIPRYRYELFNVDSESPCDTFATCTGPVSYSDAASSGKNYTVVNNNYYVYDENIPVINVTFEKSTTPKSDGTCNGTYQTETNGCDYTHPAFTWGTGVNTSELEGLWAGKFQASNSLSYPQVKPNQVSLRSEPTTDIYNAISLFDTTTYLTSQGTTMADIHLTKNTEWGAIAYLKQSSYGLGSIEMGSNLAHDYASFLYMTEIITGCGSPVGGAYNWEGGSIACDSYNTTNGQLASTTGNITGIYDMSGANSEYVMAFLLTSDNASIYYDYEGSITGFTASTLPIEMCSSNTYINCYSSIHEYDMSSRILGDAIGETFWYSSYSNNNFIYSDNNYSRTVLLRGGNWAYNRDSIFDFRAPATSSANPYGAGRPIIILP